MAVLAQKKRRMAAMELPDNQAWRAIFEEVGIPAVQAERPGVLYSPEQIVDAAFTWYRAHGFPYRNVPRHVCMQQINKLAAMDFDALLGTSEAYHVADTYNTHRFHAAAEGKLSPFDSFNDDRRLRAALEKELARAGTIGQGLLGMMLLVLGTQACANFRPGFATYLYRQYCHKGARVLDTSTGYGGRLVGFIAAGIAGQYVGIDPNVPTYNGNQRLAVDLAPEGSVDLICAPAEDVPVDRIGASSCDFAFTSPPYFRKEHYSDDDTQSWKRYGDDATGETWREGFLAPTMVLQFACLKPGAHAIMNIADIHIGKKHYPLADWCVEVAKRAGFEYVTRYDFGLQHRMGANQKSVEQYDEGAASLVGEEWARKNTSYQDFTGSEPVLVFRKPAEPGAENAPRPIEVSVTLTTAPPADPPEVLDVTKIEPVDGVLVVSGDEAVAVPEAVTISDAPLGDADDDCPF